MILSHLSLLQFKVGLVSLHRVLEEQEEEDFGQVRGVCPSFAI